MADVVKSSTATVSVVAVCLLVAFVSSSLAAPAAVVHRPTNYQMKIFVNLVIEGDKFSLEVDSFDKIESVKTKIENVVHIPPDLQVLIFKGEELLDGRNLAYYNIHHGSTIDLYLDVKTTSF